MRNFVCPGCVRRLEREGEEMDDSLEVEGEDWQRMNISLIW
jgi:hypothetical protein